MAQFDEIATRGMVLLGCGKMGSALLEGWLAGGMPPSAITVLEPNPSQRLTDLAAQGLRLNADLPSDPVVAVLAVKPQMMGAALPRLAALSGGGAFFLSIAAGTPIRAFEAAFGDGARIVRAMPNTPAAVGRGITAIIGNDAAGEEGLALAEALLSAVGETVRLETEAQIDAVTVVSGSGPAYVFLLVETLAAAGVAQGLAPDLAERLARVTIEGSGRLSEASAADSPEQMRVNVTSPGGTTAAALRVLMAEQAGLDDLMKRAVAAGVARARELAES